LNVVVDWMRDEIYHQGGRRCRLAAREAGLLACRARKVGIPVFQGPILLQDRHLEPRRTHTCTIDMHVSLLRRELLDDDAEGTRVLITVYLVGYMRHRDAISSDDVPPAPVAAGRVSWELITGLESLSTP
jgi:DNA-binding response OmpR family regulator